MLVYFHGNVNIIEKDWINIERFQPGFIRKHMDLHLGYRHSQDDVQQPKKYHTNHCFLDLKVTRHQGFTIVHICWERTGKPGTNLEKPWKHLETPWKNHGNTMEKPSNLQVYHQDLHSYSPSRWIPAQFPFLRNDSEKFHAFWTRRLRPCAKRWWRVWRCLEERGTTWWTRLYV